MITKKTETILFALLIIFSCKSITNPSEIKMKECLSNELASKAIVTSYEQQDGLAREKDGVKYYEGYFNAEIKFIANTGNFKAGEQYKIIKATLSFMKTDNGWNCQSFDIAASNFVKIKEQAENSNHIAASNNEQVKTPTEANMSDTLTTSAITQNGSSNTEEDLFEPGNYIVNGNDDRKVYFHNAPDKATKRAAYFSTQENVFVEKVQNGFGYIKFTSPKGTSSYGWVLMKYLIVQPN